MAHPPSPQEFSGGDEAIAERSLLSAIHGRDTVDSALLSADLRQHLQAATGKHQVGDQSRAVHP